MVAEQVIAVNYKSIALAFLQVQCFVYHHGSIEPCAESLAGMPKSSLHFA